MTECQTVSIAVEVLVKFFTGVFAGMGVIFVVALIWARLTG